MDETGSSSDVNPQAKAATPIIAKAVAVSERIKAHPHRRTIIASSAVVAIALAIGIFNLVQGGISFFVPKNNYVPVYTLVSDKISRSGAIVVNLPKGVSRSGAEQRVTFDPVISGEWKKSSIPDAVVYKPNDALALGKHYLVSLATDKGTLKKDFVVDEDPAIVNVFPDSSAEADLNSAITIVFNRPMVPLTTLSELENKTVPVSISPDTPGKFKWISTRTLQFIPSSTLFGSAHYTVSVRPDFASVDGLTLPAKTFSFTTKQMRLDHTTNSTIVYNQPINFYFNQPVDLNKTLPAITLKTSANGAQLQSVATYGKKSVWDEKERKYKDVEDTSIISILPKNTSYGHANVWNFSALYSASIAVVYPIGGDIPLKGPVTANVKTSPVIKDLSVESDNSDLTSAQLFDPAGTTTFSFYEDIDVGKSQIRAKGLENISFGQKCDEKDKNKYGYFSPNCKKVEDKSQLILSFDPATFAKGEKVPVTFEKLVNTGGYQLNDSAIVTDLTVYPQLKILKTLPAQKTGAASVNDLVMCTNSPLKPQDAKSFYKNFKANKYLVFGRWDNPYLQSHNDYEKNPPCEDGQYVNRVHYGLLPTQSYTIDATIADAFGQSAEVHLNITTGPAPKFYLKLQNLQKIYNVTTPEHTKFTYATENFDFVNAFVCRVSPESMVRLLAARPSETDTTSNDSLPCTDSVAKTIARKSDQWVNQYFQLDLKDYFEDPRGQYVISFSHPSYRNGEGKALYARTYASVTNLAVVDNRVKWSSYDYLPDVPDLTPADTRGSVFWLSRMHTLLSEPNANISIFTSHERYRSDAPVSLADSKKTNSEGFAEFPLIANITGAAITAGDESAVISQWTDTLSNGSWEESHQNDRVYAYTDRPIYRPGQQVFIKGIYRVDFDGILKIFRDNDILIEVNDSKGNVVLKQNVPVSAYGTFATDVTLPKDAPLGTYSLRVRNQWSSFDVQEYVGAAFETIASTDKDEYVAGETANLSVSGKYYFGVPLDGGTLDYSITSQNYYFDRYSDEYFNFGNYWYDCYDCGYGDSYLKSDNVTLDSQGTAKVSIPLDFGSLYKGGDGDQSKIFVFHGTIKDKQGKSVSFEKSFIVHRGEFYVGAKADPSFTSVKEPFTLRVKTVDDQGKATSKSNISVTLNKVGWQSAKRQEVDGGFYSRSQRTLTPVFSRNITTSPAGEFSENDTLNEPGEYEIDVVGRDSRGNQIKSTSEIYIAGPGSVDVQPTNNATLNIKTEQTDVHVGDTAKFIIQNPYPHARALISIERGRIFSYEVVDIDQSMYEYQFPVTEDYAPNIFASVVLLSPDPGVKYGQVEFTVDKKEKELHIGIKPDKQSYLPGEKVNLIVTTTDYAGNPVPADVSISVADVSVLALKGNPKKDPLVFFYGDLPLTVTSETNIKNLLEETPIPTGTKGGDGGSPADLATRKRGEFKDTAYWQADVVTDSRGTATVSFTLPDNLTKWQIESVGTTKDTKLGVKYQEIVAQKEVMTVPIAPRFVVPGDEFMVGAKIFNQTQQTQTLNVAFESPTLKILDAARTQRTIKPGETATVYFSVRAPLEMTTGTHSFTLSAGNDAYNDTVEQKFPITNNETYEYTATAGSGTLENITEYLYLPDNVLKDRGGLTIKTSATLAVYLSDAFTYLFQYPYGCSEQLASKLSAIAIAKRALKVPNVGAKFTVPTVRFDGTDYTADEAVAIGLGKIYDNQNVDGGFAFYKGMQSDPYLTASVIDSLTQLKRAGYSVRQNTTDNAIRYLYAQLPKFENSADIDTLAHFAYVLSSADPGSTSLSALSNWIENKADSRYISDKASSDTLGYMAVLAANRGTSGAFKSKVFAALINRVDIDSRGAYVKTNERNAGFMYFETPEKNTALFLKALVADKRDFTETPNMIRWLLASRSSDGSWGSTNTSVAAIDALSDYLSWKRETESRFNLTTTLDEQKISSTDFTGDNVMTSEQTFLPIAKIDLGTLHTLTFTKTNANSLPNTFYYDMSLKYYLPVQQIAPRDEGIAVERNMYALTDALRQHPLTHAKVGDVVRGVITFIAPKEHHTLSVENYIPAGFELVNFDLATEDEESITGTVGSTEDPRDGEYAYVSTGAASLSGLSPMTPWPISQRSMLAFAGIFGAKTTPENAPQQLSYARFYPAFQEMRDDRLFLFAQNVRPGAYEYVYYLRATTPGTFSNLPAVVSDMYFPENFGRTAGSVFTVEQ